MHVQVNGRYLAHRITGVQRYAREIVARLGHRVEVIAPRGSVTGVRGHLWEQTILPCQLKGGLLPSSVKKWFDTHVDKVRFDPKRLQKPEEAT